MEVSVYNIKGEDTGRKVTLSDAVFGIEPNDHVIYLAVKQYMANRRQGTHKSKERREVFGPKPRDYSFKLNKKVKALARCSALSYKAAGNAVMVLEDFSFDSPKTKQIIDLVNNLKLSDKKLLLVMKESDKNVYLSARNLGKVNVQTVTGVNTYNVLNANVLLFTESALAMFDNNLK